MSNVIPITACPRCQGSHRIPVVYGYPDEELAEESRLGRVALAGCIVPVDAAQWFCPDCQHTWGRRPYD